MRPSLRDLGVGLLLACLAGACDRTSAPGAARGHRLVRPELPAAADVARVRIIPQVTLPSGAWPKELLTQPEEVAEVLAWLRGIDWDAEPFDVSKADMPPVSRLTLEKRDGAELDFAPVDGGIIYRGWDWRADTEKLKDILRKARP
jgi:hypothetical protein